MIIIVALKTVGRASLKVDSIIGLLTINEGTRLTLIELMSGKRSNMNSIVRNYMTLN